ncbi:non-ribosomal peptide synthetase [Streptomyces sp. SID12501]|uniref:Amino acid adenylation domain-containing protein n=1 Tax=Streptomyces sp. SID12501 TaxID=2706042 RepID=A0A6B3BQ80_9ACTN|nr:non-ribosomal peptide synthetase [Streptomyces sp. SID12501]NEC86500.1 amino acid adenylation domain-containing protein [Streptomyces sp. SID12501]
MQPDPTWNRTARTYPDGDSLHGIVRAHARTRPDALALVHGTRTVTYGLLDRASDAYAVQLAALGVGRGDLVPVRLPRGAELAAAVLAVLKLGAAYALLDGGWPRSRVADVLVQLDAKVLIDAPGGELPESSPVARWCPPPGGLTAAAGDADPDFEPVAAAGGDPACVFFTSGTTGSPKGVLTPHRATVRLFRPGPGGFARFGPGTVMPQAAPVPWDGYSLELWSVLLNGGTSLVVDEPYLSPQGLRAGVARHGVGTAWLTSSLFNMIVDEDLAAFDGMTQVMIGGERLSAPHVRRFLARHPGIALINGYGPVESTVFATTHRISPADCDRPAGIPIGRPVPDTQVYVLDGDRLCAIGEPGELCVAGDGLALRYLGRPELTAEKFTQVAVDGLRLRVYRTGDVAHWDKDGLLHYGGRADRQVKIRGHRIEPAEVERQIEQLLPGVRHCAVVARRDEDTGTCLSLAAFCVPHRPGDTLDGALDTLRSALVRHHVPEALMSIERFPLTGNGKLDERAMLGLLPAPGPPAPPAPAAEAASAPGDPVVALVAAVFGEVLGLTEIPVDADFTALGGTSLAAGRVCARLSARLERPVPVSLLFQHPSANALGERLRSSGETGTGFPAESLPKPLPDAEIPLGPVQEGFLTRHLLVPDDRAGHCLAAWTIDGPLDLAALRQAVADVHERHPALRSAYVMGRGRTYAVPDSATAPGIVALPTAPAEEAAFTAVRTALAEPLDLAEGQVWRAALAPVDGGRRAVFGYVVHHIAFDGWSESVLAGDLAAAYNARLVGDVPDRPVLPSAPRTWALREAHLAAADLPGQRERLKAVLRGVPDLRLPAAGGGTGVLRVEVPLTARETAGVNREAAATGLTRFAVLLSRYAAALAELTGQDDFGIGVPLAQRTDTRLEEAVGCHIGMVCLRMRGPALTADRAATAATGRLVREAFACQDVGIAEAVRLVNPPRTSRSPLFQTIFAYQDNTPARLALRDARTAFRRLPYLGIPTEIQAEVWPDGEALRIVLNADAGAVSGDFVRSLAKTFSDLVRTTGAS